VSLRVEAYEYGSIGGVVNITDGWTAARLKGTKHEVIDQIVRLQYDLSVALDDVSEWHG
jgi:hypothetical protein